MTTLADELQEAADAHDNVAAFRMEHGLKSDAAYHRARAARLRARAAVVREATPAITGDAFASGWSACLRRIAGPDLPPAPPKELP